MSETAWRDNAWNVTFWGLLWCTLMVFLVHVMG
jgi:hypothetical protein